MNLLIMMGILLAGGTIAFDRLFGRLSEGTAIVLYGIAAVMIIAGMIISRKTSKTGQK
ncbi:MAG: hypothetical protein IKD71_08000 [Solobacterium sp.]|nr:hypothetical protein [Solobacterium sp.]